MENSKKRKRDADCPRISYHTSTRTFDRLFQENSLAEMKEVARRKLGLDLCTSIVLAQIRDGKSVDLEDDDDFDAFYALAHSMSSVDVKVTVVERQSEAPLSTPATPSKKKKRKLDKKAISEVNDGQLYQKPLTEDGHLVAQISKTSLDAGGEPRKKKNKTGSGDIEAGEGQLISQAREKPNLENGSIVAQTVEAPLDATGEPRKKRKKNKTSSNESVTKADASNSAHLSRSSTTSANLQGRASEDVSMTSIQVEDATREHQKPKRVRKRQRQKERKPQADDTLPASSSSIEERSSQKKETNDKSPLSGVQGAKEPIVPVPTEPEKHKSSTEHDVSERSNGKIQEKQRKSKKQPTGSAAVNEQSDSLHTEAGTKTQLNTQEVDGNDRDGSEKADISSVNTKKLWKEPRKKLTPDERKAAAADVEAIFAKVLAAKRAAASASCNVTSPERQDDVVSSSRTKKRKSIVHESSEPLRPDPLPVNAGEVDKTTVDVISAKVLAAKQVVATASVNANSAEKQGNVVSFSKPKKKKNLVPESSVSFRPDPRPANNGGVGPSQDAAGHSKSRSGDDCPKLGSTCPLCLLSPSHKNMACPLVLGGPEALRERLLELQEASDDRQSNRLEVISELHELLRLAEETSKIDTEPTPNSHPSQLSHPRNQSLTGDHPDELSSSKNGIPSHTKMPTPQTTETSGTSDDSSDDEGSSHGNELSSVPHNPKLLETVNLDDLIRGPVSAAARIADLVSDSSEDEEDKDDQILEEDEPEAPRRSRKTGGLLDSSDEADSGLDDTQSITEEGSQNFTPNDDASPQCELLPSSRMDHVSFKAVDRIGESQEADRSADAVFGVALEKDTAILNPMVLPQGTPATETSQSLAPSSRRADLVNTVEVTPLDSTSTPALPVGPSALLVSTPLTSSRVSPPTHDTRDEAEPAGIVQRMRTRNGKAPVSEKSLETSTMSQTPQTRSSQASQSVQAGVARRTRAATRRETLGTMTPPVPPTLKLGRRSRLIRPAARSTEDLNVTSTFENVVSLDTWAILKPSSPVLDADATMMVDELEPSSPSLHAHMDIDNSNENEGSQDGPAGDPLFIPSESLPAFPYSQWNDESQEGIRKKPDENSEVSASVQVSRDKPKQSQNPRYRRLTDITSDHGFFSTPANLRATRSSTATATDMYGRSGKDEIESESESDSDKSDAQEESHIPKSRRAGTKQTKRK